MKDKKVIFMGTPDFSVPILEALIKELNVILVVTQPDKEVGRNKEMQFSPIKKVALKNNIEVFQPIKIRKDFQYILDKKPDIIITCAYGQLIPNELLEVSKYGAINVHASLLPKLRGGAPIHRAIIEGYEETGVTIMYMIDKMDAGDIISQEKIKIEDNFNVGILHDKLSIIGRDLLIKTLPSIFERTNKRIMQNEDEVTFAYNIKREDELLDFNKTAKDIYNQIRGLNPWPCAYAVFNGNDMKILESRIGNNINDIPGKIVNIYKDGFGVACRDKEIIITRLKEAGKKEMNASDFINGKRKENIIGRIFNE